MGEYAKFSGSRIKIGTCEDMYYLRADQARMVQHEPGNVDPVKDRESIRFRFPFPDEDGILPGAFNDYNRAIPIHGMAVPAGVEHHTVQFSSVRGYLLSLPCPESRDADWLRVVKADNSLSPVTIHRNGFSGAVKLCQQRWWEGKLVSVFRCGGCESAWRVETLEEIEPYVVALRSQADQEARRGSEYGQNFYTAIADRILLGYSI